MIKVAFFVNKKILTKDNSFFWQFNLKDLEASNHKQIEESLGFTISGIKEICENTFVAHIDKGNIESIEKHKNATAFVSLKEIESQDEDVDLLVKHIKEYYNNSEFLFDFKSTDYMTDQINTQVFGFCIDSQKRCCIVRDVSEENWTLPGGGCEF